MGERRGASFNSVASVSVLADGGAAAGASSFDNRESTTFLRRASAADCGAIVTLGLRSRLATLARGCAGAAGWAESLAESAFRSDGNCITGTGALSSSRWLLL